VGRAIAGLRLSASHYEAAFARLYDQSLPQPFGMKTTEAMHGRRFVAPQARARKRSQTPVSGWRPRYRTMGINDGNEVMFVSHTGLIHPSDFMPLPCGAFPFNDIASVYQDSPIFRRLPTPESFEGKCGYCEYQNLCGGSRARAFNVTGNPYASEPDCLDRPRSIGD
jgi:MoaA/NifB/PqqE/SkfB family radical SAM enzyme